MSPNFSHQMKCEFNLLLKPDESITALGIFKKDPSIAHLLLTRGIARYGAKEFHAAVTNQRLIVLAIQRIRGEQVISDPIEASLQDVQISKNIFNETILVVPIALLDKSLTLRFKARMEVLGLSPYDFLTALKHSQTA